MDGDNVRLLPKAKSATDELFLDDLVPLQNSRGLKLGFQEHSNNTDEPIGIACFDVDGFKSVNDDHGGHATGNEALRSIAETAVSCVRGKGSAYRLHGDEF